MLSREALVHLIVSPVLVKSWRKALRGYLRKKWITRDYVQARAFVKFKKGLCLCQAAPEKFSFPHERHPLVSIIVSAYNDHGQTRRCLWSILRNTVDVPYEVILADNCLTGEMEHIAERIQNLSVVRAESKRRNLKNCKNAVGGARGKYICFLSNDTQVQPDWLRPLLDLVESDESRGLVGSRLIYPDGTLLSAGNIVFHDASCLAYGRTDLPIKEEYCYVKEVDFVNGAALMLKRSLWEELGGFDERFVPFGYEDVDLAFRVRARGLKVVYQPQSIIVKFEEKSAGMERPAEQESLRGPDRDVFWEKWKENLQKGHGTADDLFLSRDRSATRKTLLFVDQAILTYDQDTGSRASFQYMKFFVKNGLNVKFLPQHKVPRDYHVDAIRQMGVEILCLDDEYGDGHEDWLARNGAYVDYVYLNRPDVALAFLPSLRRHTAAKIIYQGHDLHFRRLLQQYDCTKSPKVLLRAKLFERMEREVVPQMDVITYFSEDEIAEIRKWGVDKPMAAIPLYLFDLDDQFVPPHDYVASERSGVMFVGGYRHPPNVDAALFLVNEIMPKVWEQLPDLKVHLVGSHPPKKLQGLASGKVLVHGFVPDEELAGLYTQIKIACIPLRFGAGVKGKLLEAVYCHMPVITTPVGMQGIPSGGFSCVRETASQLAEEIVRLYRNDCILDKMSKCSKTFVATHYSEAVALEKFRKWIQI